MNNFLSGILVLAVISGIINSLVVSNNSLKKYVNYILGLVMAISVFSPVFSILSSFDNIKEYIEDFSHSIRTEEIIDNSSSIIVSSCEENVCNGIKELVISKFGFKETDVYVSLVCDKSDISSIKIREINVVLTNEASWSDTDRVKEYLDKAVGCKINVTRR